MRFNREKKRKMVEDILRKKRSIISASREYDIDYQALKRLVARAREYGPDNVFRAREYHSYSDSFKTTVIESVLNGNSYRKVATEFNVSYSLVRIWHKKYSESGIGSITGARRGRPLKKKDGSESATIEELKKALKEKDRELERAKIENEFLKKLDALVRERIEREDGRSSRER